MIFKRFSKILSMSGFLRVFLGCENVRAQQEMQLGATGRSATLKSATITLVMTGLSRIGYFLTTFKFIFLKNKIYLKNLKRAGQDGLPGPNVQNLAETAKKSETDFAKILTMHAKDLITRLKIVTKWSARQTFALRN